MTVTASVRTTILVGLILSVAAGSAWPQARVGGGSTSSGAARGSGIRSGSASEGSTPAGISVHLGQNSRFGHVSLGLPWFRSVARGYYGGFGYGHGLAAFYPPQPRCQSHRAPDYWLLALKDGIIRAVKDYRSEDNTLVLLLRDGTESSLPLSELDLEFTKQLNRERGIEFRLPNPKGLAGEGQPTGSSPNPDLPVPTSLKDVRAICVEQMGGYLDEYIIAEIEQRLSGRISIVLSGEGADAVLVGDYEARPVWPATVSLLDRQGQTVLWSLPVKPPGIWSGAKHARKVAGRVARKLKHAIGRADRGN